MTHRLTTNYAKHYCNRTLIVKVIIENVVTCFLRHSVEDHRNNSKPKTCCEFEINSFCRHFSLFGKEKAQDT